MNQFGEKNSLNAPEIIIVDDDPVSLFLTEEILRDHFSALNLHTFTTGPESLDFIQKSGTNCLILLDINMPEMSGWEFIKQKQVCGFINPIVLLTSSINEDDKLKAHREGVYFQNKPLNPTTIEEFL